MTLSIRTAQSIPFAAALAAGLAGFTVLVLAQAQAPANPCGPAPAVAAPGAPAAPAPPPPAPPAGAAAAAAGRGASAAAKADPPATARLLEGTDEDDKLVGGSGDDWVLGKKGNDMLSGCDGKDKMDGGEGDDHVDGGTGNDILDGGPGRDIIDGGAGNDILDGGDDDSDEDIIFGGPGDDDIDGGDGNSELHGGDGNDQIAGSDDAVDRIFGDAGNDRISGYEGNDILSGGGGNDLVFGNDNNDLLQGDAGDDRCDGGEGIDLIFGGAGDDTLLGSTDSDTLHGEIGHDHLFGGDGNDLLDGGAGLDWLMGGAGADTVSGGLGNDIFLIRAGDVPTGSFELIDGGAGTDVLFVSGFMRAIKVGDDFRVIDPSTGGVYIIVNVERVEHTMVLSPALQAGAHTMSLLIVNPSSAAVTGRVMFFGATGAVVSAAMANQPAREQLTFSVPSLGSLRLTDVRLPEAAVAQIFASAPLSSSVQGGPAGPTVIHGQSMLLDSAIVPALEQANFGTGVLIVNSSTASSVRLTLRKMDGSEMDEQVGSPHQLSVPAYGHRVVYMRDLYPSIKEYRGTLTVESGYGGDWSQEGGSISVMLLNRATGAAVTGLPAAPSEPASPAGAVHLARITSGPGASSSIVLLNPMITTRTTGTLRLYDEAGAPWAGLGDRPTASIPFDIAAAGSVVIPVAAGTGSARVDVTRGKIAALVRVTSGAQVSHLASNDFAEGFIAAAFRDRSAGLTTSLAVSAGAAAVSVRIELRTANGEMVQGGEATLKLAANAQAARTLEQLFPSAALDAFDGTMTIRAEGGSVAASVLRVGAAGSQPVALPVIRLQ